MTIFRSAYDTRACDGYGTILKRIIEDIQKAIISGATMHFGDLSEILEIRNGDSAFSYFQNTPAFAHPLVFKDTENRLQIAIDTRTCTRYDRQAGESIVSNHIEYGIITTRARLNQIWIENSPNMLRDISPLPMMAFSTWIAENLRSRFSLDGREQMVIQIIAAYYYLCLFTDETKFSDMDQMRMVNSIAKATRISAQDILAVTDRLGDGPIMNVVQLCDAIGDITDSVRLKDFNVGLLSTIISRTWFGANAAEQLIVALEHPPTWITIVRACLAERTYHKSGISRILERYNTNVTHPFLLSMKNLLDN